MLIGGVQFKMDLIPFFHEPLRKIPRAAWPGILWGSIALALQAEEFEKLGDMGSAEQIREQATVLQTEYRKTCG